MLEIRKYPNRRFYDATRSRHVTLPEVYNLIRNGEDVSITDQRTGEDITNLILFQMLLENDHPKLDLFPSAILHWVIRSNRQVLRSSVEQFFGPLMEMVAKSQKQFDGFIRQTFRGAMTSPMDWASQMLNAFSGVRNSDPVKPEPEMDAEEPSAAGDANLADLRDQVEALTQRIEELSVDKSRGETE